MANDINDNEWTERNEPHADALLAQHESERTEMLGGIGDLNKLLPGIMKMSEATQTELVTIRKLLSQIVDLQMRQVDYQYQQVAAITGRPSCADLWTSPTWEGRGPYRSAGIPQGPICTDRPGLTRSDD
ncbi:MAG TPA: hypothetical protein VEF72_04925 [Mycobacterium sp.]|nr:hypothetical protein [Mycobacterium sp.]